MQIAAAKAIADFIPPAELTPEHIIPRVIDNGLAQAVAKAVRQAYKEPGDFE